MDLTTYVDALRRELVVAAEAGGDDARALAERLAVPLESATRLALLEALSAAADEITRDLAPGSVEVRLRGRDPEFVVTGPPADHDQPFDEPTGTTEPGYLPPVVAAPPDTEDGDAGTTRITLRLPAHLKPRIDEAAGRAGLSSNAWLVRAVSAALNPGDPRDPRGSRDPRDPRAAGPDGRPGTPFGRRYRGWVR